MAYLADQHFARSGQASLRNATVNAQNLVRSGSAALLAMSAAIMLYEAVPQARITTEVQNQLTIEHNQFGAVGQPQVIRLRLEHSGSEPVTLRLDEASSRHYVIDSSLPVANTVSIADAATTFTFDPPANSDVFDVELTVKPLNWGRQVLTLNASIAQRVTVQASMTEFVAPRLQMSWNF